MSDYNEKLKPIVDEIAVDAINAALTALGDSQLLISKEKIAELFPHDYSREISEAANRAEDILCATLVALAVSYVGSLKKSAGKGK